VSEDGVRVGNDQMTDDASATVRKGARRWGVIVVEPLPVVRTGLQLLIDREPDLEVLAATGDADGALRALAHSRRTRVTVLVALDLDGEQDAAWLIREVRERYPTHAVLAVGTEADPARISRALFVGADGFVDKEVETDVFIMSIRQVRERQTVLAGLPPVAIGLIADRIEQRRDLDALLTAREREVLTVAAEGLTAKEMAGRLGVRERTVTTHLGRIYSKLGVPGRLAAVRVATRAGLVNGSSDGS
jgi:DNA-binding NarL/FixJ family response regulator